MKPESPERLVDSDDFIESFRRILEGLAGETKTGKSRLFGSGKKERNAISSIRNNEDPEVLKRLHHLVSEHFFSGTAASSQQSAQISSQVKQLISSKDSPLRKKSGADELAKILSRPHFKQLLATHDNVASRNYEPLLPEIPHEVDEDEGVAVKIVRLVKNQEPLGATIKFDDARNLVVARVMKGGVADRSGCIQVGDIVLEVNGKNAQGKNPTEVVEILAAARGTVTFKLLPGPDQISLPSLDDSQTLSTPRVAYRSRIDYDPKDDPLHPCPEASVSFRKGDILLIVDSSDDHWWQASVLESGLFHTGIIQEVGTPGEKNRAGLIPSPRLQERRSVSTSDTSSVGSSSRKLKKVMYELRQSQTFQSEEAWSYEEVSLLYPRPGLSRPLVLIGPPGVGRNELKRRLILVNPDRFTSTVPHTSRPPKPGEVEGVDYFFVDRAQMEVWVRNGRFIEFGEYRCNLYGTMLDSVRDIVESGGTPVLSPHPAALKLLRSATLQPLVVFIKPPPFPTLKESRSASRALSPSQPSYTRGFTDTELQQMIQNSAYLEQNYGHLFDYTLVNGNLEFAFRELTDLIQRMDCEPQWVPTSWVK